MRVTNKGKFATKYKHLANYRMMNHDLYPERVDNGRIIYIEKLTFFQVFIDTINA